jgi:hypothetical protein
MTVTLSSPSGDKGDARGDTAPAAGVAPVCISPALHHPQCAAAWRGSRFWALAEDSSKDEDDAASIRSSQSSPPRPSQVTVGDFLSAAFAKPSAGSAGIRRGKRAAFAPGGRGPRWLSRPRCWRAPPAALPSPVPPWCYSGQGRRVGGADVRAGLPALAYFVRIAVLACSAGGGAGSGSRSFPLGGPHSPRSLW